MASFKMIGPKPPSGRGWVYDPAGAFRVPTDIKQEVQRQAQNLIDSILKPRYVQLPDKKTQFNYLVDIHSKWRGPFFYFCSTYCSLALMRFLLPSSRSLPDYSTLEMGNSILPTSATPKNGAR